jgi:hypothetical protein
MFALRYAALTALVLWVGGTLLVLLAGTESLELRLLHRIAIGCGGVIFVALVAMKFIGPPPRAFTLRAAIVAVMLAIAVCAALPAARGLYTMLTTVNVVAGLFLLSFYVRE